MADTDVVFQGFYYAVGYTVSVSVCGLDCGDYMVDGNGAVTVPINSDPDGNFNGGYLGQFDVGPYDKVTYGDQTTRLDIFDGVGGTETIYVPVVIGFTYPAIGQVARPVAEDQIKSPQGPGLGKTRRAQWFGALLNNTQGISFGTQLAGTMDLAPLGDPAGNVLPKNTLFSGVWAKPLDDPYTYDGQLSWIATRPYAVTVCAVSAFIDTSER
jgi:hypothetical protein